METLVRGLLLIGGVAVIVVFIGFGLFFLGWVISQHQNGW
jgi:hypothetical protein